VGDEVVHVFVPDRGAGRHPEKENGGQGLVQVEPQNLTESRKTGHSGAGDAPHVAQFAFVTEAAQNAVVEDAGHQASVFALHETPEILFHVFRQTCSANQQQFLTRRDIAVKMNPLGFSVQFGDGSDKQFFAHRDGK
jgi:hypothetical protein